MPKRTDKKYEKTYLRVLTDDYAGNTVQRGARSLHVTTLRTGYHDGTIIGSLLEESKALGSCGYSSEAGHC